MAMQPQPPKDPSNFPAGTDLGAWEQDGMYHMMEK
jgi:hypothetical protein